MLVSMKSILDEANTNRYAVMAVNSISMEMVRAVITAAEEERSPIIINLGPGQMKRHANPDVIVPIIKILAEKASVPVALNLDHGTEFNVITDSIRRGFTNIMIDASSYPFEENVRRTKTVVSLAHKKGISVEAELGHVGQASVGDYDKHDFYTDPDKAVEFIERTNVDALAVAFGTAHGSYPLGFIPKLDFDRLTKIKEKVKIPLVMHGGSGSGEENVIRAVECGINKINVATDAFNAGKQALLKLLQNDPEADYLELMIEAEQGIKKFVKDYIRLIGSNDRYTFKETPRQYLSESYE